jgi:hypothetical protein
MIWRINFGLWAVAWAGLWKKRVWADYEQLLRPVFPLFWGQNFFNFFFENTIASALKSCMVKIFFFFEISFSEKTYFFRA